MKLVGQKADKIPFSFRCIVFKDEILNGSMEPCINRCCTYPVFYFRNPFFMISGIDVYQLNYFIELLMDI